MSPRKRAAILISGRGSNMAALIAAARAPDFPAEIALVLSNKPDAPGLALAKSAGIAAAAVDHKIYGGRDAFERTMQVVLDIHRIELICLAGFMRILSAPFVERWRGRILNIHPSLLPAFRGLDTHRRALEAGVKTHGCTVHFVEPELDAGPIIAQCAVPILESDTPDSLGARVLEKEHELYPKALALVAEGRARIEGAGIASARIFAKNSRSAVISSYRRAKPIHSEVARRRASPLPRCDGTRVLRRRPRQSYDSGRSRCES